MNRFLCAMALILATSGSSFGDVLLFSPDGKYTKLASITEANSAPEASGKTIVITSFQKIQGNTTLAGDRAWRFEYGGGINIGKYSLTINGFVDAGLYRVFSGTGGVIFGAGSVRKVVPEWFGAKGDGTTDCSIAFQKAVESLRSTGGTLELSGTSRYYLGSTVTVGNNVSIRGPHEFIGSPGSNSSANYGSLGGALLINPQATINLKSSAGLSGLLIQRSNMTFPASDASAFSGTAITVAGDDVFVSRCMVLGFNKAFYSNGFQRPRIEHLWGDNNSGIDISNCLDIPYISNCHMWPFVTIASPSKKQNWADRPGPAFYLHDTVDWAKLTNCFSYGYTEGFTISNANSITLVSCSVDGTKNLKGSIGFNIRGTSTETKLIGCQAAAQDTGYLVNTGPSQATLMDSCSAWGNTVTPDSRNITLQIGDLSVNGGVFRDGLTGVVVGHPKSRVVVSGVKFINIRLADVQNIGHSPYITMANNDLSN